VIELNGFNLCLLFLKQPDLVLLLLGFIEDH